MDNSSNLDQILPDNLSESTVQAIMEMVDSIISEQVNERVTLLEAKVTAFLRTKVDRLKDQALTELSEESDVFRNARLFESVRSLMSLELNANDETNVVNHVVSEQKELQEELEVLTEQLNSLLSENEKLQNTVKVLDNKLSLTEEAVVSLGEERQELIEEVQNLHAVNEESFRSSEKAVLISEADVEEVSEQRTHSNEFLTDEVMKFMPFTNN
jgi:uncharacterized protein YfcZ (UPF0381/DUF406 family)